MFLLTTVLWLNKIDLNINKQIPMHIQKDTHTNKLTNAYTRHTHKLRHKDTPTFRHAYKKTHTHSDLHT